MKHLILGTAGHVDHGKTSLVKALTGIECDTHKEEKRRGITINLGFAHLNLPNGDTIGIVDVPGHKDFIHTMVSGANGIDIVLLVVAADSGIMPQTKEHLHILQLLGIRSGIIVLTRIDIAEPDVALLAAEEIRDFVKGTFLETSSIVNVSSVTGEGIDELKKQIVMTAESLPQRDYGSGFRMYIDRIFSVSGFGTVVTGSVIGGVIKSGDQAFVMPAGNVVKVKRLQRHGTDVDEVCAGDRASINLSGLTRDEFSRGMMITDRLLRTTKMIDASIELFESSRKLNLWSQAMLLLGTFEAQVKIHLIDHDTLLPGSNGIAQIHFSEQCTVQFGDRFILRSSSGDITLGGGTVIDSAPLHHRRRPDILIDRLEQLASGDKHDFIAEEIRKTNGPVTAVQLAKKLNLTIEQIADARNNFSSDIITLHVDNIMFFIVENSLEKIKKSCIQTISNHHKQNPLNEEGKTVEELCSGAGLKNGQDEICFLRNMLDGLCKDGTLKMVRHTYAHHSHSLTISKDLELYITFIESFLKKSDLKVPLMSELDTECAKMGIKPDNQKKILNYLLKKELIYRVEGSFIHTDVVSKVKNAIAGRYGNTAEKFTIAQFRDLIDGNRKLCIALVTIYLATGFLERDGDYYTVKECTGCK